MPNCVTRIAALAGVLLLAACSSLPIGTAGGGGSARTVDYLNDDVAGLLLALDLPPSLEPAPRGSTLKLDITGPSGERHVEAALVAADADDLAGTLPPPADGRNYYLFGFSAADQQAIRAAQAWAKTLAPGSATVSTAFSPRFCRTEEMDPARTTVSVLVALPGVPGLSPLLRNTPVSTILAAAPIKDVPPCAGHSG